MERSFHKYASNFANVFGSFSPLLRILGQYPDHGTHETSVSLFISSFPIKSPIFEDILRHKHQKRVEEEEIEGESEDEDEEKTDTQKKDPLSCIELFVEFSNLETKKIELTPDCFYRRKNVKIFSEYPEADYIVNFEIPKFEKSDSLNFYIQLFPGTKVEIKSVDSPMFQYLNETDHETRKDIEDGIIENPNFLNLFVETFKIEEFRSFIIPEKRDQLKERDISMISKYKSLGLARKVYDSKTRKILLKLPEYCRSFRKRWRELFDIINRQKAIAEEVENIQTLRILQTSEKKIVRDLRKILNVFVFLFPGDNRTYLTRGCPYYDFAKTEVTRDLVNFFEVVSEKVNDEKVSKSDPSLLKTYRDSESLLFKIFTDWNKNEFYSRDLISNSPLIPLLVKSVRKSVSELKEPRMEIIWILSQFCRDGSRNRVEWLLHLKYLPVLIEFILRSNSNYVMLQFAIFGLKNLMDVNVLNQEDNFTKFYYYENVDCGKVRECVEKILSFETVDHLTLIYVLEILIKLSEVEDLLSWDGLWASLSASLGRAEQSVEAGQGGQTKKKKKKRSPQIVMLRQIDSLYVQLVTKHHDANSTTQMNEEVLTEIMRIMKSKRYEDDNDVQKKRRTGEKNIKEEILHLLIQSIDRDRDVMGHEKRLPIYYQVVMEIFTFILITTKDNDARDKLIQKYLKPNEIVTMKLINIVNHMNISTKTSTDVLLRIPSLIDNGYFDTIYEKVLTDYVKRNNETLKIKNMSDTRIFSVILSREENKEDSSIDPYEYVRSQFCSTIILDFLNHLEMYLTTKLKNEEGKESANVSSMYDSFVDQEFRYLVSLRYEYDSVPVKIGSSEMMENRRMETNDVTKFHRGVIDDNRGNLLVPYYFEFEEVIQLKKDEKDDDESKKKEEEEEEEEEGKKEEKKESKKKEGEEEEEKKKEKKKRGEFGDFIETLKLIFENKKIKVESSKDEEKKKKEKKEKEEEEEEVEGEDN